MSEERVCGVCKKPLVRRYGESLYMLSKREACSKGHQAKLNRAWLAEQALKSQPPDPWAGVCFPSVAEPPQPVFLGKRPGVTHVHSESSAAWAPI